MGNQLITGAAALWGGGTGLLIPRAAYRLSVTPDEPWRAVCPAGHPIAGPARGWIGRAQCPDGTSYGPNAPLLAMITALTCAALAFTSGNRPELAVWLLLVPVAVLLAAVDLAMHRLPDILTLPLAATALALLGAASALPHTGGRWTTAVLGSLALAACHFAIFLLPSGIGFGDVKLSLALGAILGWYGWAILLIGTFAGYLLGAVYGAILLITRRAGRQTTIPFGPFLLGGALLGLLTGSAFR
ncbi:prepilin peptidase [Streptomyces sp. NPDC020801]|uniref:prepilin peptidase n=1 Tax=Streptomyces sp. NPDC020801 TaxID=3365093 RepID=UPI00378807CA